MANEKREQAIHELKVWPEYFNALKLGLKNFEIRKNDRDFQIGDTLRLREYDDDEMIYSGEEIEKTVTYIAQGVFGLPDDVCVMSLATAAEGIPQADGWVDVAVSLPPAKEGWNHSEQCLVWYQPSLDAVGNYGIAYYHYDPPYRPCEWVDFAHLGRDPIAWQPLPTPYQRQSSEGDVKTNIFESRGWDGK